MVGGNAGGRGERVGVVDVAVGESTSPVTARVMDERIVARDAGG